MMMMNGQWFCIIRIILSLKKKNINEWPFQSTVSHFGRTRIQRLQAAIVPEISVPLRLSKCLGHSTPLSKHFRSLGPLGWEQPSLLWDKAAGRMPWVQRIRAALLSMATRHVATCWTWKALKEVIEQAPLILNPSCGDHPILCKETTIDTIGLQRCFPFCRDAWNWGNLKPLFRPPICLATLTPLQLCHVEPHERSGGWQFHQPWSLVAKWTAWNRIGPGIWHHCGLENSGTTVFEKGFLEACCVWRTSFKSIQFSSPCRALPRRQAAIAQPKIAATRHAFALCCVGDHKVVTWGDPHRGAAQERSADL